ncbi:MAG TPA: hypothetical protein VGR28_05840 [Candidatus Thermoplasmatota archaeon]|jgi:hypothetical protein|nr:hypothetical protein [Candidatus Thermoplasmatota archaeon]
MSRKSERVRHGKEFLRETAARDRFVPAGSKPPSALRSTHAPSKGGRGGRR